MTSPLRSEHSFPAVKLVESFHSNNHEPVRDENMSMNHSALQDKFCPRCKDYLPRSSFSVIPVRYGYRKDRLCVLCRAAKTMLKEASARRVRKQTPVVIRKNELALIPNPFVKAPRVFIQDQSFLLWSECV